MRKNKVQLILASVILTAFLLPSLVMAQTPGDRAPVPGMHPSFSRTDIMPLGQKIQVGALDWLPNGKLVIATLNVTSAHCHLCGPSDILVLDGVEMGNRATVTVQKVASNFNGPLGMLVKDGSIFVADNQEGIVELQDKDGDGFMETHRVIHNQAFLPPLNQDKPSGKIDRRWSYGLKYKDDAFFVNIGVVISGNTVPTVQPPLRGVMLRISADGDTVEPFSGGLRNPNSLVFGPENEFFTTDNQGEYKPTCQVLHLKKNRFYGRMQTAFDFQPTTPPVAWLPRFRVSNSASDLLFLEQEPFKGQFLIGEITTGGMINRLSMEKVNDEYQGAVFLFADQLQSGVNRLLKGRNGTIFYGGAGGNSGWSQGNIKVWYDLARLDPTGIVPFEMRAIRSTGLRTMEVEFTKPAGPEAANLANYGVRSWKYAITPNYGGPELDSKSLPVTGVVLSPDRLRAKLEISGLKIGYVIYVRLIEIKSTLGETPWTTEGWYTLNAFGPGTDPPFGMEKDEKQQPNWRRHGPRLFPTFSTALTRVEIYDLKGNKHYALKPDIEGAFKIPQTSLKRGIYLMKAYSRGGISTTKLYWR